jgi:hypothetical protein
LWVVVGITGGVTAQGVPTAVTCTHSGAAAFTQRIAITPGALSKSALYVYSTTGATGSGTVSVTFAGNPADATVIVIETPSNWTAITGITTTPINSGTAANPSVTTSATPTTNDRVVLFSSHRNINADPVAGSGFTKVDSFFGTSPVCAVYIEDRSGTTSTTADITSGASTVSNSEAALIIQGSASGPSATQTDDAGLTDSVSISMVRGQTNTDDAGITDSSTLVFNRGQINTDDAGLTDSATAQIQHNVAQTDSAGLTDSATVALVHNVTQTDDSGLTDSTVLSFIRGVSQTDLVGLTDSSTATVFPPPSATTTDIVGLTDSFVVVIVHGGLVAGTIMDQIMADLISRGYLVGTVLDREYKRLVDATGVPNGGAGKTIDDLYALNNERNRVALESVAIIPKT